MPTLTPDHLKIYATKCSDISNELADGDGFVSARKLAARFDADLILRPLLVEGMLASIEPATVNPQNGTTHQWAVFLDSETYSNVTDGDVQHEGAHAPLPPRMRNTIAHELAHSLAFRSAEFGVEFTRRDKNSGKSLSDIVETIERETEKLSPLLLIPEQFLDSVFPFNKKAISISELHMAYQRMGVSRYVLINRFNLLRLFDKKNLLNRPCLTRLAIGIGKWVTESEAHLENWPLYVNFERNIVPEFLLTLRNGQLPPINKIFSDPSFSLCGGESHEVESTVPAGTPRNPRCEKLKIRFSVEPSSRKKGSTFLFLVQAIDT